MVGNEHEHALAGEASFESTRERLANDIFGKEARRGDSLRVKAQIRFRTEAVLRTSGEVSMWWRDRPAGALLSTRGRVLEVRRERGKHRLNALHRRACHQARTDCADSEVSSRIAG